MLESVGTPSPNRRSHVRAHAGGPRRRATDATGGAARASGRPVDPTAHRGDASASAHTRATVRAHERWGMGAEGPGPASLAAAHSDRCSRPGSGAAHRWPWRRRHRSPPAPVRPWRPAWPLSAGSVPGLSARHLAARPAPAHETAGAPVAEPDLTGRPHGQDPTECRGTPRKPHFFDILLDLRGSIPARPAGMERCQSGPTPAGWSTAWGGVARPLPATPHGAAQSAAVVASSPPSHRSRTVHPAQSVRLSG